MCPPAVGALQHITGGADADTHGNAILTPRMFWCNTLQPRGISEDYSRFVSGGDGCSYSSRQTIFCSQIASDLGGCGGC